MERVPLDFIDSVAANLRDSSRFSEFCAQIDPEDAYWWRRVFGDHAERRIEISVLLCFGQTPSYSLTLYKTPASDVWDFSRLRKLNPKFVHVREIVMRARHTSARTFADCKLEELVEYIRLLTLDCELQFEVRRGDDRAVAVLSALRYANFSDISVSALSYSESLDEFLISQLRSCALKQFSLCSIRCSVDLCSAIEEFVLATDYRHVFVPKAKFDETFFTALLDVPVAECDKTVHLQLSIDWKLLKNTNKALRTFDAEGIVVWRREDGAEVHATLITGSRAAPVEVRLTHSATRIERKRQNPVARFVLRSLEKSGIRDRLDRILFKCVDYAEQLAMIFGLSF